MKSDNMVLLRMKYWNVINEEYKKSELSAMPIAQEMMLMWIFGR